MTRYLAFMRRASATMVCLAAAACGAPQQPPPRGSVPLTLTFDPPQVDDIAECGRELYAYAGVIALAQNFGEDADVFTDALADLREQLADCLNNPPADLIPVDQRGARRMPRAARF